MSHNFPTIPARQKPTDGRYLEHWAVCQVFSKRAQRIRFEAEEANVGTFLPTYARIHYRDGKRSSSERQLLPGYLFVRLTPDDRARVAELEGVYGLLSGGELAAARLEREMAHLVVGHATGAFNQIEVAPDVERVRRRRRRPRPGRRARARRAALAAGLCERSG